MKQDRFETIKKYSFVICVLIGAAFLAAGLAQVFLSMENESAKLNLCLFMVDALLGMSIIFIGFIFSGIAQKLQSIEEKLEEEDEHLEEGL